MQKVIAKIYLENIRNNAEEFRSLVDTKLCAVVKANAYGHGAEEVAGALNGIADVFAVALIDEAERIKTAACGKEILVFTPPISEEETFALAVDGFSATLPDLWTAKLVSRVCAKYRLPLNVHLKINTGMNRYGMEPLMLEKVCEYLQADPFVRVTGIYSHLCECKKDRAELQRKLFLESERLCRRYFPCVTAHLSASYGATLGKDFTFDMVRIGLGLYGYQPLGSERELPLKKGMEVYARTVSDRKYTFGGAGYGEEFSKAEKAETDRLSVCRFGYADGFLRARANGVVGFQQNAGNLCMDACIRRNSSKRGELIPILLDAAKTALYTDTIPYEVLCAATRRAEFVYE